MRLQGRIAVITAALAFGAVPAAAVAVGPPAGVVPTNDGTARMPASPGSQGTANRPATPGPSASLPAKAKAYGTYCAKESKKHVAGQKGTPFGQCVTAMAKLAGGQAKSPRTACKGESRKRVEGEKGTPFSLCVAAGAKLLADQAAD